MKKRRYEQKKRAEGQDRTRARIVEAIVALHEEVGPAATTVSAIADRAGVQRLTVYRHFPDEAAQYAACSAHWIGQHPLPDPTLWRTQTGWQARTRAALAAIYSWYRRNTPMLASIFHDASGPRATAEMLAPIENFQRFYAAVEQDVLEGCPFANSKAFRMTLSHVLAFATWHGLAKDATDEELVALAMRWLEGSGSPSSAERLEGPSEARGRA